MLKIKDNTSKRSPKGLQDIKFWENDIILDLVNMYKYKWSNELVIIDEIVNNYNRLAKQNKSDIAFVRQVRKLNKEGYLDVKNSKI